jgi:hypothetical protein
VSQLAGLAGPFLANVARIVRAWARFWASVEVQAKGLVVGCVAMSGFLFLGSGSFLATTSIRGASVRVNRYRRNLSRFFHRKAIAAETSASVHEGAHSASAPSCELPYQPALISASQRV